MEQGTGEFYDRLAKAATETVDLDRIEALAQDVRGEALGVRGKRDRVGQDQNRRTPHRVRIGVAYDQAFCFYYPDNLELLEAEGAEVVKFSPMKDQALPNVDMLYLGGGYPELHGERLAENLGMRTAIKTFAERGGTIYAECGGMMYLTQAIRDLAGKFHEMVGLFAAVAVMSREKMTLGYRELQISQPCVLGEVGVNVRGHEFHYSLVEPTGQLQYACMLRDAQGKSKGQDGLVAGNTVGLYSHLHFASQPKIAASLIASARMTTRPSSASLGGVR
jgi:cobyrinic acid a,c-diamide synthase